MTDLLNELSFSFPENFSITTYILNIVIAAIILFILSIIYRKYGNSISNRNQLSKVLIIVGLTTFIIISIVKSSLALSLGLVGALSIIRFRTAIKEPEELGYFFIAICIGLGMGANQLFPTLIGFGLLAIVIVLLSKNKRNNSLTQNLVVQGNSTNKNNYVSSISGIIKKNSRQVELKRLNHNENKVHINFLINVADLNSILSITKEIQDTDPNASVTFLDNEI